MRSAYIGGMTRIALSLALLLSLGLSPLAAQEVPPAEPPSEVEEGSELLKRGAELLLRGLMDEIEPTLRDMEGALAEMEPAARELIEMLGDLRNYEPPEKLPNGDILIRRKTEADPQIEL